VIHSTGVRCLQPISPPTFPGELGCQHSS
jgi:hypothetical protein